MTPWRGGKRCTLCKSFLETKNCLTPGFPESDFFLQNKGQENVHEHKNQVIFILVFLTTSLKKKKIIMSTANTLIQTSKLISSASLVSLQEKKKITFGNYDNESCKYTNIDIKLTQTEMTCC